VLTFVFEKELVRRLLDRLSALCAAFLLDNLAVAFLQAAPLAAFLFDGLVPVRGAGGTPVPAPVSLNS